MSIGKKKLVRLIARLDAIREKSTMKTVSFDNLGHAKDSTVYVGLEPVNNGNVTVMIQERTKLWRRSYITDPLAEMIAELKRELDHL